MALHEALLHRIELAVDLEALDGADLVAARPSRRAPCNVLTGSSSTHTTQVPQLLVSQPQCVPVRPQVVAQEVDEQRCAARSRAVTSSPLMVIVTPWMLTFPSCSVLAGRPGDGLAQRADGELLREVRLVVDRAALSVDGVAVVGGDLADLRVQLLRGRLPAQRLGDRFDVGEVRTDRTQTRPARRRSPSTVRTRHRHRRPGRRDGPVARPPLHLVVGARRVRPDRDAHLGEHLAVPDRRLVRPVVEVVPSPRPVHPNARGSRNSHPAHRTPPRDPPTGRPGTAIRRASPGCARPGRRSPARRRGRSEGRRRDRRSRAAARCRVSAPMRTSSSSIRMYSSSLLRSLMSIRYSGVASRSFIIGRRLCPPGDDAGPRSPVAP